MKHAAHDAETFALERDGHPAGNATVFCAEDGSFVWGWERTDGLRFTGAGYGSHGAAHDALLATVGAHYAGLQ